MSINANMNLEGNDISLTPNDVSININYSSPLIWAHATPVRAMFAPIAPWAPPRTQRINAEELFATNLPATNLSAEFEEAALPEVPTFPEFSPNFIQYLRMFPNEEENNYYLNGDFYTLDVQFPHPNVTVSRGGGNYDPFSVFEDAPHPNVTVFRGGNPDQDSDDDDSIFMELDEDAPHPNVTYFRGGNPDQDSDDDSLSLMSIDEE